VWVKLSFIGPLKIMGIRRVNETCTVDFTIRRFIVRKREKFGATGVKKMANS
jgi:hypothetical protein